MRRVLLVVIGFFCFLPLQARAEQVTVWDFRNSIIPGKWDVLSWDNLEPTAEGLHIRAVQDGRIVRAAALTHPVDMVSFLFTNAKPAKATILWRTKEMPPDQLIQLPFSVLGDVGREERVDLDMTTVPEWDGRPEMLGFSLAAGTDITLQEIRMSHAGAMDRIVEGFRSFWTFDEYRPYSINFLWGPLLTYNSANRESLFENLPPRGRSAVILFYLVLAVAALVLTAHRLATARKGQQVALFFLIFLGLWIMFDMRMGAETLSYAYTDYQSYIRKPRHERMLRTFLDFNGAAEAVLEEVKDERYGFIVPPGTLLPPMLRYYGYPRLPITNREPDRSLRYWFVFRENGASVNEQGELIVDGKALSGSGEIITRFGETSFLFEVTR